MKHTITSQPWYREAYIVVIAIIMFLSFWFLCRAFIVEAFRMPADAMLPTIKKGDIILVEKWGYGNYQSFSIQISNAENKNPITRGEVMAFSYPANPKINYVMRVIGLPGDVIKFNGKELTVNGVIAKRTATGQSYRDRDTSDTLTFFEESIDSVTYMIAMNESNPLPTMPFDTINHKNRKDCKIEKFLMECKIPPNELFMLGDSRDNSFDSRYWGFVHNKNIFGRIYLIIR